MFLLVAEPATVGRFACDEAEVLPNFRVFPKPRGRPLESDHELAIRDFILQHSFNFGLVVFIRIQGILGLANLRRNALEKHSFRQGLQNVSLVLRQQTHKSLRKTGHSLFPGVKEVWGGDRREWFATETMISP